MLKRINTDDKDIELIQDNVDSALSPLQASATSNASLLTSVSLKSGQDNLVAHKLDRQIQFWILAGISVNSAVWSPVSTQLSNQSSNDKFVNLRCSSNCTVSLVVG